MRLPPPPIQPSAGSAPSSNGTLGWMLGGPRAPVSREGAAPVEKKELDSAADDAKYHSKSNVNTDSPGSSSKSARTPTSSQRLRVLASFTEVSLNGRARLTLKCFNAPRLGALG